MAAYYFSTSSCVSEFLIDFPASSPTSVVSEATGFKCISVHSAASVVNDLDKILWLSGSLAFLKCCHSFVSKFWVYASLPFSRPLEGFHLKPLIAVTPGSALASMCQSVYNTINI